MPRRTKQEAQATREHLLDAAESLFLSRGIHRCALQDIAQAAGLTRGAIYWHFEDKVALVKALLLRVELPMDQALNTATHDAGLDGMTHLRTLAKAPFALIQRDPRLRRTFALLLQHREFVGELAPLLAHHEEAVLRWTRHMEGLFRTARRAGQLKPGISPEVATKGLLALLDGLMRKATVSEDPRTYRIAEATIDALLDGLSNTIPGTALAGAGDTASTQPTQRHGAPSKARPGLADPGAITPIAR